MSTNNSELVGADEVCASCGTAAVDDVTLKKCACNLVKYCTVDCQKNHRSRHKKECKKRLTEMHDTKLFTQPDSSHLGECSICCLPLSTDAKKSTMMGCCCKIICNGCERANKMREREQGLEHRCAFCRNPSPKSDEEYDKHLMKRIKKNDPVAMSQMAKKHYKNGDYGKAFEYWTNAAELGDAEAHGGLGLMHEDGNGVEKDEKKAVYHWEEAAIKGHAQGRFCLAVHDMKSDRFERAAKHFIINANLGCERSLKVIKDLFVQGVVSKEKYAAALRGHQAAVDAAKSAERDDAEAFQAFHKGHTN
jgi:disulfide oxidoreductase YuzD